MVHHLLLVFVIEMFGVSDHLQLRLEATANLEAAQLALAVCMEKVS